MVTFEDITTVDLIYLGGVSLELKEILKNFEIKNFQELKDFTLPENFPNADLYLEALSLLQKAENTMFNINNERWLVKVYNWPGSENDHFQRLVTKTDQEILASFLPYRLTNPSGYINHGYLEKINIYNLKYLASKITFDGKNALIKLIFGIGSKNIAEMIDNVAFYNDQLQRVFKENPETNENLFLINKDEKEKIIKENFEDIVRQLFSLGKNFIFGATYSGGPGLAKAIIKAYNIFSKGDFSPKKSYTYHCVACPLIELLSNYTTLEELKNGPSSLVLKRFVK